MDKQRTLKTRQQEKAYHLAFTQIADELVAHGVSLDIALRGLDIRPTAENIKTIFRKIAQVKYGIESTTQLYSNQVNEVFDDLTKALSINTGVEFIFPSEENREEAMQSLDRSINQ